MKRVTMFLLVVIGLVAMTHHAFADDPVTSVNVVGFKRITIPPSGKLLNVGMNFDAFEPSLMGVFGTNQLRQANDEGENGDSIAIWDATKQKYSKYVQMAMDGQFHDVGDLYGSPTNPPLRAGESLWIKSPASSSETRDVTLAGEAVPVVWVTNKVFQGLQMLAYPFSADTDLQTNTLAVGANGADEEPDLADQIALWNSTSQSYTRFALRNDDRKWHDIGDFFGEANPVLLKMGEAFWFRSRTNGFDWIESAPYQL